MGVNPKVTAMLHRLRQISFVVDSLSQAQNRYESYLGMKSVFSDATPETQSSVLYAGDGGFVELLQPLSPNGDAAKHLAARGQGPYELIFDTVQFDPLVNRLNAANVRISDVTQWRGGRSVAVDPASANGARLRIVERGPLWPPSGPDWQLNAAPPHTLRLRQIAVLVRDLDEAVARWGDMFALKATKRFQISFTGLEIAVLPLAGRDTFLELAQPTSPNAPSQRFLDRYGEGIYLTIYEIADSLAMDAHLVEQGARFTSSRQTANYTNLGFNSIWLHPAGFMGAFTQLSQVLSPDNPWPPAGDDWRLE